MIKRGIFAGSIAMSWMWGLGLFFSVHFTFVYGWVGLLSFAIPNALGLVLFGWVLQRRADKGELKALAEAAFVKHPVVFGLYQAAAVALTLFAVIAYFMTPLNLAYAGFAGLTVLAVGVLVGEVLGIRRLIPLQAACLVVAVIAAGVLLGIAPHQPHTPIEGAGLSFAGFAVPLVVGLLFGPFFDVQQWQRAVELQKKGVPVAQGFALGGLLFFGLLMINGTIAMALTGGLEAARFAGPDGWLHAQAAVTTALHAAGGGPAEVFYGIWVLLCVVTTFDSAQAALAWFVPTVARKNDNALMAMLPADLLNSTLPLLVLSAVAGVGAWIAGLHLEHFMILYASLFVAYSASLAFDLIRGTQPRTLSPVTLFCGIVSMLTLSVGYFEHAPLMMIFGSLIALFPLGLEAVQSPDTGAGDTADRADGQPPTQSSITVRAMSNGADPALNGALNGSHSGTGDGTAMAEHHYAHPDGLFNGKWFEVRLTATYNDTNSVGNIYFANYVAWVGKTRELFFRHCMPAFDLKQTPFYILTRSFNHKFVREAKEFDEVMVRLRIGKYNRKFVNLEHKLFDGHQNLLGEGDQSLMFVRSDDYHLIDIPKDVVTAFTPYV